MVPIMQLSLDAGAGLNQTSICSSASNVSGQLNITVRGKNGGKAKKNTEAILGQHKLALLIWNGNQQLCSTLH
jgi:hypothetical protein